MMAAVDENTLGGYFLPAFAIPSNEPGTQLLLCLCFTGDAISLKHQICLKNNCKQFIIIIPLIVIQHIHHPVPFHLLSTSSFYFLFTNFDVETNHRRSGKQQGGYTSFPKQHQTPPTISTYLYSQLCQVGGQGI